MRMRNTFLTTDKTEEKDMGRGRGRGRFLCMLSQLDIKDGLGTLIAIALHTVMVLDIYLGCHYVPGTALSDFK